MEFNIKEDIHKLNYETLGFKSGLEIHQQLNTKKLFCDCPSIIRDDNPDFIIKRRLRASSGESGKIDKAAVHEVLKSKEFHYQGYYDTTCLVELDEEPPHEINKEALSIALQTGKMMKINFFPKAQVMRKIVIDGSNTSGFQRTTLLGMNGIIKGNFGTVRIQSLCLEEDASKIIKRNQNYDVYNLSKLGIPLIEIATYPDLKTPESVKDAALHIGMILRSTRKVKRGIGTIRQDVNVSIRDGARVEIKGVQDIKRVPEIIKKEIARQSGLVKLKKILKNKNIKFNEGKIIDLTKEFREFNINKGFLQKTIKKNNVIAFGLPKLKGLFGTELYEGYRIGTELSGYAKSVGFGGLIHADEDEKKYYLQGGFDIVKKKLELNEKDSFIILIGDKEKAIKTITDILIPRIKDLWKGVLNEVRKDNSDGSTVYMRPMPGDARMYPETDIPNIEIKTKNIIIPKMLDEQIKDFMKKYELNESLAKETIDEELFEKLIKKYPNIKPKFIAEIIINYPKEIHKRENRTVDLKIVNEIIKQYSTNTIPKEAIYELMVDSAYGRTLNYDKFKMLSKKEIEKIIDKIITNNKGLSINGLMGAAMKELRGKADGKFIIELLRKKEKRK